jgi:hypothetical protein
MFPDPNSLTWQSLYAHIESRIAGVLETLELIKSNFHTDHQAQMSASWEHQLEMLQWCLPLVKDIQNREELQTICPIMSLDVIRLRCRSHNNEVRSSDFAWLTPVAQERFKLVRLGQSQSQKADILWAFEGETSEIIEKIETLVKEICAQQTQ